MVERACVFGGAGWLGEGVLGSWLREREQVMRTRLARSAALGRFSASRIWRALSKGGDGAESKGET